jgi:hypothetical protein
MSQVQVMHVEKIGGQPGQQQVKNIIVGAVAESEADYFRLFDQIGEWSSRGRADGVFWLRATALDVLALDGG